MVKDYSSINWYRPIKLDAYAVGQNDNDQQVMLSTGLSFSKTRAKYYARTGR